MTKVVTCTIKQARPSDEEIEGFWKLYRAAQRVEDRWCRNTVPPIAEELSNTNLSRQEKMLLLRAWQILVDGSGGFGRLMGAFDTYAHNLQNPAADYIDLKPSLQQLWADGELLPVVLEAYEEARANVPHHNGMMQLSQELVEAKRRITELEKQRNTLIDCANFYRLGFRPIKSKFGIEYKPTEQLLDDCGNMAIEALKVSDTDRTAQEGVA
ncbi:hypothetical protein EXT62_10185 [Pectobacterium carotovorum subsp. carotovorum]|nr:hypothetical protein [Pectobacterium carotovorum]MCL6397253.1 hypothetical protein [Pectobacterium carotovorum subsp. carotovorum]